MKAFPVSLTEWQLACRIGMEIIARGNCNPNRKPRYGSRPERGRLRKPNFIQRSDRSVLTAELGCVVDLSEQQS